MKRLAQRLPRNSDAFSGDRRRKKNIFFYWFTNIHLKKWAILLDFDISGCQSPPHLP